MSNLPMSVRVLLAAAVFPLFGLLLSNVSIVMSACIVAAIFLLSFMAGYVGENALHMPFGVVVFTVPTAIMTTIGAAFSLTRGVVAMMVVGMISLCIAIPLARKK